MPYIKIVNTIPESLININVSEVLNPKQTSEGEKLPTKSELYETLSEFLKAEDLCPLEDFFKINNLDDLDKLNYTSLHLAAKNYSVGNTVLSALLDLDNSAAWHNSLTPTARAELIDKLASIYKQHYSPALSLENDQGYRPIDLVFKNFAQFNFPYATIKDLIPDDFDVNKTIDQSSERYINFAARNGRLDLLKFFVDDLNADFSAKKNLSSQSLFHAILKCQNNSIKQEMLQWLLQDNRYEQLECDLSKEHITLWLEEEPANEVGYDKPDDFGFSPMHYACLYPGENPAEHNPFWKKYRVSEGLEKTPAVFFNHFSSGEYAGCDIFWLLLQKGLLSETFSTIQHNVLFRLLINKELKLNPNAHPAKEDQPKKWPTTAYLFCKFLIDNYDRLKSNERNNSQITIQNFLENFLSKLIESQFDFNIMSKEYYEYGSIASMIVKLEGVKRLKKIRAQGPLYIDLTVPYLFDRSDKGYSLANYLIDQQEFEFLEQCFTEIDFRFDQAFISRQEHNLLTALFKQGQGKMAHDIIKNSFDSLDELYSYIQSLTEEEYKCLCSDGDYKRAYQELIEMLFILNTFLSNDELPLYLSDIERQGELAAVMTRFVEWPDDFKFKSDFSEKLTLLLGFIQSQDFSIDVQGQLFNIFSAFKTEHFPIWNQEQTQFSTLNAQIEFSRISIAKHNPPKSFHNIVAQQVMAKEKLMDENAELRRKLEKYEGHILDKGTNKKKTQKGGFFAIGKDEIAEPGVSAKEGSQNPLETSPMKEDAKECDEANNVQTTTESALARLGL